jgi:hypothetical protein
MGGTLPERVFETRLTCPRCGSKILSDGVHAWCSFSPGDGQTPCLYGIHPKVKVQDVTR